MREPDIDNCLSNLKLISKAKSQTLREIESSRTFAALFTKTILAALTKVDII